MAVHRGQPGWVQHWKHGWIPISPDAKAYVAGRGPKPRPGVTRYPNSIRELETISPPEGMIARVSNGQIITKVSNSPVTFVERLDGERATDQQKRQVADIANDVLRDLPGARDRPLVFSFSSMMPNTVMAETAMVLPHAIKINKMMWDEPSQVYRAMDSMQVNHFGVTADADSLEGFRKNVITHEIGHVLHMRDEEENGYSSQPELLAPEGGEIDDLAKELVTPRDFGYTDVNPPVNGPYTLDTPTPRWQVDSLEKQSAYALQNKYEWFAEAFTEGTIHGAHATESGKRAVALAKKLYGKESP